MRKELKKVAAVMLVGTVLLTSGCGAKGIAKQGAVKIGLTEEEILEYPRFMSEETTFKYEDIIGKDWVFNDSVCVQKVRFEEDGTFTYTESCGNIIGFWNEYSKFTYNEEEKKIELMSDDAKIDNGEIEIMAYWGDRVLFGTDTGMREFYLKGSEPNVPVVDKYYEFGHHSFVTVFDKCGNAMLTTHKKYDGGDDVDKDYLTSEIC